MGGGSTPKITILGIWYSEEQASAELLPVLKEMSDAFAEQGVQVLALNDKEQNKAITAFLDEHHLEIPVAIDPFGNVSNAFQLKMLPCVFVIDKEGIIRNVYSEYVATIGGDLRTDVTQLLGAQGDTQPQNDTQLQSVAEEPGSENQAGGIAIWDTIVPSEIPMAPANVLAKDGWRPISRGDKPHSFDGDAVLGNDRVLAVFRKQDPVVDVFSLTQQGAFSRAKLQVWGGGAAGSKARSVGRRRKHARGGRPTSHVSDRRRFTNCREISHEAGRDFTGN